MTEEMKVVMGYYLVPYTSAAPDYNAVQVATILSLVDWMGFLIVLLNYPLPEAI
jgi:hypothetical protein